MEKVDHIYFILSSFVKFTKFYLVLKGISFICSSFWDINKRKFEVRVMAAFILVQSAIYGSTDTTEHVQEKSCTLRVECEVFSITCAWKKGDGGSTKCLGICEVLHFWTGSTSVLLQHFWLIGLKSQRKLKFRFIKEFALQTQPGFSISASLAGKMYIWKSYSIRFHLVLTHVFLIISVKNLSQGFHIPTFIMIKKMLCLKWRPRRVLLGVLEGLLVLLILLQRIRYYYFAIFDPFFTLLNKTLQEK